MSARKNQQKLGTQSFTEDWLLGALCMTCTKIPDSYKTSRYSAWNIFYKQYINTLHHRWMVGNFLKANF
jgi:hypothetical protein